jgi:hypothetical protein
VFFASFRVHPLTVACDGGVVEAGTPVAFTEGNAADHAAQSDGAEALFPNN